MSLINKGIKKVFKKTKLQPLTVLLAGLRTLPGTAYQQWRCKAALFFYEFNIRHGQKVIGKAAECFVINNYKINAFKTYLLQRWVKGEYKMIVSMCFVFYKCENIGI